MDITEVIRSRIGDLTRKQKSVAEYMISHPDEMAYITLRDLSKKTGVTEITILNACQALGYNGISSLKYEFRQFMLMDQKTDVMEEKDSYSEGVPQYEQSGKERFLEKIGNDEIKMINTYWKTLNLDNIFRAAELFMESDRILLCGRGFSFIVAEHLQSYLSYSDIFSTVINTELNDTTYCAFSAIREDTLVVAISLPDYYFMTVKIAEYAKSKANARLLAITDRENSEVASIADLVLTAPTMTSVFINTLSSVMMLLNLLGSALNYLKSKKENGPADKDRRKL